MLHRLQAVTRQVGKLADEPATATEHARCRVVGCGGLLRFGQDEYGRVYDICDDCAKRVERVKMLEGAVRALQKAQNAEMAAASLKLADAEIARLRDALKVAESAAATKGATAYFTCVDCKQTVGYVFAGGRARLYCDACRRQRAVSKSARIRADHAATEGRTQRQLDKAVWRRVLGYLLTHPGARVADIAAALGKPTRHITTEMNFLRRTNRVRNQLDTEHKGRGRRFRWFAIKDAAEVRPKRSVAA